MFENDTKVRENVTMTNGVKQCKGFKGSSRI